ncbi:Na+/H+ antiporter NhaA [Spartinivicinus poritis]|uniref:Na+/H+ antiporter NhaA n=1 Tax=Spartinivicinus poritis TaxID=2994640 RepID=A0ABT5UAJ0_9GAMM|nr:Na+/H+ antiporter NhaA [Spartinivicinus sp. A2-2]MDE1463391.1 Na+/H+ antiporter NhaA [Spartinivicinus sp. A2-2]
MLQLGQPGQNGWGTVMATDTAFVIGCLALLGSRIPQSLRIFMLSVAIVDDIGAILVVSIGYGSRIHWEILALSAIGVVIVRVMALLGIRSITLYFLIGGIIWLIIDASGVHATITGIILGLMTPTVKWVTDKHLHTILDSVGVMPEANHKKNATTHRMALRTAEAAAREALSPVERLETLLHPWVGFVIMPLFAFANAGVLINITDFGNSITIAVFLGFTLGKPIGVFIFSWIAVLTGIALRPANLSWLLLLAGGFLAGIGFTMALFIANLAFSPTLINSAKLGIFSASLFSAILGISLLSLWAVFGKNKLNNSMDY